MLNDTSVVDINHSKSIFVIQSHYYPKLNFVQFTGDKRLTRAGCCQYF